MERSELSLLMEQTFGEIKNKQRIIYIAAWKESKDPKVEILSHKPDPEKWFFIECEVIG